VSDQRIINMTYHDFMEALKKYSQDTGASAIKFYNGDHWQGSNKWVGPRPALSDPGGKSTLLEIERGFVSRNALKEVVKRHVSGILGKPLGWEIEGESKIEEALRVWWTDKKIQETILHALTVALLTRRGYMRLFITPDLIDETGSIPPMDLEEALQEVHLQCTGFDENDLIYVESKARLWREPRSQKLVGLYPYREKPDGESAELNYLEITLVDDQEKTVVAILTEFGEGTVLRGENTGIVDLHGNLTHFQLSLDPFITPQIEEQQALLNLACSMKQRNVVLAGFLERTLFNAQLPGSYEIDDSGEETFVPDDFQVGAGVTNRLVGITYTDAEGNERLANPSIVYRDPVPVTTFLDTEESAYKAILQETNQLFSLISGDATPTGEAHKQSRNSYESSLRPTSLEVGKALKWVVETAYYLASSMISPTAPPTINVIPDVEIDLGPLSPDERRVIMEEKERGFSSLSHARRRLGVTEEEFSGEEEEEELISVVNSTASGEESSSELTQPS